MGRVLPGFTPAAVSLLVVLSGCAAVGGYRREPSPAPLPPSLRTERLSSERGLALEPTDASTKTRTDRPDGPTGPGIEGRVVSLVEVADEAELRSNIVLEAAARIDEASGRVQSADGELIPGARLDLGGGYLGGRDINNAGEVLDDLIYGRVEPSVSVYYRINPGAAIARSRYRRDAADAIGYDALEAKRVARLQASLAYLDLSLAHASVAIAADLESEAAHFMEISEARSVAEVGTDIDVARAEAELLRARQVSLRARNRWQQASVRLATLLRWDPGEALIPSEDELRTVALIDARQADAIVAEAEQQRPDLKAAERRAEAAQRLTRAQWWELVGPEIDAGVRERLLGTQFNDLRPTTLAHLFVGISFEFGQLGRLRSARGEARGSEIRRQAVEDRIRGEVAAALVRAQIASERIDEAEAGVAVADRSYRIQLDRFRAGAGLGIEVIDAQNARARARQDLAEAIIEFNVAHVQLAAAAGHTGDELYER